MTSTLHQLKRLFLASFFEVVSVLLALTTGIFGAAGFFLQFSFFNVKQFILFQLAAVCFCVFMGWHPLIVVVFGLSILTLLYNFYKKISFFWRVAFSSLAATTVFCLGILAWGYWAYGFELYDVSVRFFDRALLALPEAGAQLNSESIIRQLPSYFFCLSAINIWLALVLLKKNKKQMHLFTVPAGFMWVFIAALLFSFVSFGVVGVQDVALNVLNVSLLLYFFQGLSVLAFILNALRFSTLIKTAIYFIFILQILLPTCLGVLDYWFNFRQRLVDRLSKKTEDEDFN